MPSDFRVRTWTASATTGRSPTTICSRTTSAPIATWACPASAATRPSRPARRRRCRRIPINAYGRKAAEGMNALGWHWWPAPNAIASRDYGNLQRCARYGTCETGCPHGAKASVDLTHWPEAIKHGARLVTGARVREITVDAPRPGERRRLPRPRRRRASSGGRPRGAGGQRRRHAAADAAVAVAAASRGSRELVRPGRPPPDAAPDRRRGRVLRRGSRVVEGAGGPADPLVPVLRDRHRPRLRRGAPSGR